MKRKIKSVVLICVLIVCMGGLNAAAAARDASDTYFYEFEITPRDYAMPYSNYRKKDGPTSVYVYLTGAADYRYDYVKVRTFGTGKTNLTCGSDGRRKDQVSCYIGMQYEVYNSIWESGYRTANIGLCSANFVNSQIVSGRWSPDTEGHFTVAN